MAQLRGSEMLFGRSDYPEDYPADYLDTTAVPVLTRTANHGPAAPSPYDGPPLPPYEPISPYSPAPKHFLPPYDYVHESGASMPRAMPPMGGRHDMPPNDFADNVGTRPPPQRREVLPPYDPPADMVIPGVQHPDGRFEPHPNFARRSAPLGVPVDPEGLEQPRQHPDARFEPPPYPARRSAPLGFPEEPEQLRQHPDSRFEPHPYPVHRSAPLELPEEPGQRKQHPDARFEPHPYPGRSSAPLGLPEERGQPRQHPDARFKPHPYSARSSAPPGLPEKPDQLRQHPDGGFEPYPYADHRSGPHGPLVEPELPRKKTVEVAVPVCCEECKERIVNYVGQTPGVDDVECDVSDQRVKVTGELPPAAVLKRCQKCFKKSKLV